MEKVEKQFKGKTIKREPNSEQSESKAERECELFVKQNMFLNILIGEMRKRLGSRVANEIYDVAVKEYRSTENSKNE